MNKTRDGTIRPKSRGAPKYRNGPDHPRWREVTNLKTIKYAKKLELLKATSFAFRLPISPLDLESSSACHSTSVTTNNASDHFIIEDIYLSGPHELSRARAGPLLVLITSFRDWGARKTQTRRECGKHSGFNRREGSCLSIKFGHRHTYRTGYDNHGSRINSDTMQVARRKNTTGLRLPVWNQ